MTHFTGNVAWDSIATMSIGALLGAVGLQLMDLNRQFLFGKTIDQSVERQIVDLIKSRPTIDAVHSIQSQWIGTDSFSFKAEVDFDGTHLAAQLHERYHPIFREKIQTQSDFETNLGKWGTISHETITYLTYHVKLLYQRWYCHIMQRM